MYKNKSTHTAYAQGFTLIEVLVSLTILAIGLIGIMSAFSFSTQIATRSVRLADAATIAQSKLELIVAGQANHLEPNTGSVGLYQWEITFEERDLGLALASVVVRWTERGTPKSFRLSQIFWPRG